MDKVRKLLDVLSGPVRAACERGAAVGAHGRAQRALAQLHLGDKKFTHTDNLMLPTLGLYTLLIAMLCMDKVRRLLDVISGSWAIEELNGRSPSCIWAIRSLLTRITSHCIDKVRKLIDKLFNNLRGFVRFLLTFLLNKIASISLKLK